MWHGYDIAQLLCADIILKFLCLWLIKDLYDIVCYNSIMQYCSAICQKSSFQLYTIEIFLHCFSSVLLFYSIYP